MNYLLSPLALIFWLLSEFRNFLYDLSVLKSKKIAVPVICIGNISTGGTGKTPWVQFVSKYLESKNKNVSIVSRGYGGDYEGVLEVQNDMDPKICGDEPLWLKRNTKASVFLSKSRYDGALRAIAEKDPDVILLDDGYQHRKLHRDLDIVLLDASASQKSSWLLPMGRLRESFKRLNRAGVVIINKCNYSNAKSVEEIYSKCTGNVNKDVVWKSDFLFKEWTALLSQQHQTFKDKNISICCGLGNPQAFVKTVEAQNFKPVETFIFPDHFYWRPIDIEKMTYQMKNSQSFDLMITEKDAVKLSRYEKHFKEMGIQLWVCNMQVKINGDESDFFQTIDKVLES